jgi:hypothetical protein
MLLPQDLYILLKLCCLKSEWTFQLLSDQLFVSKSQISAGLRRAEESGLFSEYRRRPVKMAVEEFIIHGVRYVYPVEQGGLINGLPTSFAASPLKAMIVADTKLLPVWPYDKGKILGYTIEPLHPAAPRAALLDSSFYELLCLVDAIRDGRARERQLAKKEIHNRLRN